MRRYIPYLFVGLAILASFAIVLAGETKAQRTIVVEGAPYDVVFGPAGPTLQIKWWYSPPVYSFRAGGVSPMPKQECRGEVICSEEMEPEDYLACMAQDPDCLSDCQTICNAQIPGSWCMMCGIEQDQNGNYYCSDERLCSHPW